MKRRDFLAVSIGTTLAGRYGVARAQTLPCPPPVMGVGGGGSMQNPCVASDNGAAVAPNSVVLVGTNSEDSVRPGVFSAGQWQYSLFASWSGGAFVPGWGTHGAYVCAGTGGHGAPENFDGVLFDFADFTWKYLPNTNGVPANPATVQPGQTNGSPWYEMSGTEVPAPSHCYKRIVGIGNVFYKTVSMYVLPSASATDRSHKYTLNANGTGTWSRASSNGAYAAFPGYGSYGGTDSVTSFYDPVRNRIWEFPTMTHYVSTVPWLNVASGVWSGTSVNNLTEEGNGRAVLIHDEDADCVFVGKSTGNLYRVDLGGSSLSYSPVSSTATASIGMSGPAEGTRWHKYPVSDGGDGCFYTYIDNGSRQLKKFDPVSRIFSNVIVANGPALPRIGSAIYPNQSTHFTRFCYVPARKCFAWIPGNGQQVALLRP